MYAERQYAVQDFRYGRSVSARCCSALGLYCMRCARVRTAERLSDYFAMGLFFLSAIATVAVLAKEFGLSAARFSTKLEVSNAIRHLKHHQRQGGFFQNVFSRPNLVALIYINNQAMGVAAITLQQTLVALTVALSYDWEPSALGVNLILPLQIVGILALHVLPGLANNYSMFCLSCVAFVVSSSIAAFTFVATTQRMVLSPLAFVLSLCSSNVAEQVYKIVPVAILAATCPAQLFASVTTGTSLLEGILGACLPVPMTHVYTLGSSLGLWSTSAYTLGYCSFLSMQGLALVISRNLYT